MAEKSPSRIPTLLRRSSSVRVRGERPFILYSTSPVPVIREKEEYKLLTETPLRKKKMLHSQSQASNLNLHDDDLDSLASFASGVSRTSVRSNCQCKHSLFAKNGTTYSGRMNKYVVHCPAHSFGTPEEYLTPTQRDKREVRRLKTLLQLARDEIVKKDMEIFKLKEVVELKVYKTSVNDCFSDHSSPRSNGEDVEDREVPEESVDHEERSPNHSPENYSFLLSPQDNASPKDSPREHLSPSFFHRDTVTATPDFLLSSLADSGQFDDLASSLSIHSKDSLLQKEIAGDEINTHDSELQGLTAAHEENVSQIIECFEKKQICAEAEFEKKIEELLKKTEEEKIEIIEEFEKQLNLLKQELKNNDNYYIEKVEEQKAIYEQSLAEIKAVFQQDRIRMEENFEAVMAEERKKFEDAAALIEHEYETKRKEFTSRAINAELKNEELEQKYEESLRHIAELEKANEALKHSIEEQEATQKELYLKMFLKGQQAVKFQEEDAVTEAASVQVPELVMQLKVTEVELENLKDKEYRDQHKDEDGVCLISAKEALSLWMLAARKTMYKRLRERQTKGPSTPPTAEDDSRATLQFLKSAVYYFLTDRDNHLQHLRAIENILGFSREERRDIKTRYT